jgi:hypothetical protein
MTTSTSFIPTQRRPAEPGTDGLGQVAALARDGFTGLRTTHRSPRRAALWVFWLVGIVGDGWTTLAMVHSGLFAEGNPLAAVGMGFLGLTGYVVVASVVCLGMAVVSTGRPRGPVARVAVVFLLLVAAGKIAMLVSNLVLWQTMTAG